MSTVHHDPLPTTQGSSGMNPPSRIQGEHRDAQGGGTTLGRPLKAALLMVALVGGFYLLREHWGHIAGNWVYLLLLACPLMHLFHGHGEQGGHGGHAARWNKPTDKEE